MIPSANVLEEISSGGRRLLREQVGFQAIR